MRYAVISILMWFVASPLFAQSAVTQIVPDENTLARLVWTTMVSLDNANRTQNYDVLHRLGSEAFQRRNPPQALAENFAALRRERVDVGRAIMTSPNYYIPPEITDQGYLRLRGGFDYRPQSVRFDILFERSQGAWRIHALSVAQTDANAPK